MNIEPDAERSKHPPAVETYGSLVIFPTMIPVALIILSSVGFTISLFFTLVFYRVVQGSERLVPKLCRLDEQTCRAVLHHPDARLLGVPNSLAGILFSLLVLVTSAGLVSGIPLLVVAAASWCAVVVGVYLVYSLYFKVKTLCALCLIAHGVNLGVAAALTFSLIFPPEFRP